MSTQTVSRTYKTRRTSIEKPTLKSRVDWKRTKRDISQVLASEEEGFSSSEDQWQDHGHGIVNVDGSSTDYEEEQEPRKVFLQKEDAEDDYIPRAKRKRVASILYDQDSSSDEEEPVRKVFSKRRCIMDDESTDGDSDENCSLILSDSSVIQQREEGLAKVKENANARRQKRQAKLKELSEKLHNTLKSNRSGNVENEEDSTSKETSEHEDDDRGSLSSFIVEDEEEENSEDENETQSQAFHSLLLQHNIPVVSDHFVHFQRIVKAFLINAVDDTFLASLFGGTRQKRYAKEMIASLNHLDERIIAPRLENLKSRSRWKDQYKLLKVGTVCAERTRVYHQLKHFKYKLQRQCITLAKCAHNDDLSVKETVDMLFTKLKPSWLPTEYDILEKYLNEADYFQEEMI
ncbi:coiled-coil domain-containing protein 82 isoform X2 [Pleurodeles waltl]|uniref:coiled-coil domain-containing protein 82 isoform X2 n=1 Tax=Pleurodeles waltl TaxID=8319 RepID=UPI003709B28A